MSEVWWAWLLALFFASAFVFNWKTGKTHFFHIGTFDKAEEPVGFWLAQAVTASLSLLSLYHAAAPVLSALHGRA